MILMGEFPAQIRQADRKPSAGIAILVLGLLSALATGAHAQSKRDTQLGTAASGLPGLVRTGLPTSPTGLNLAATAGYEFTEPIDPVKGAHHRGLGTIAVGVVPLSWLSLALRLDGRLDMHPGAEGGARGVGDPRLLARVGHDLSPDLALGAELQLWMPGQNAPSLELGATTVDISTLLAYTPRDSRLSLLSALGFRLDNSGKSAPDLTRLAGVDRIALGLSDSHAVLIALGAAYRTSDALELFGELSADLLVGGDAPSLMASPMRVTLGGRYFLSQSLQLEIAARASPSSRPDIGATDPLAPLEPRAGITVGLRYGFLRSEPKEKFVEPDAVKPPPVVPVEPEVTAVALAGVLTDDQGTPLPDARVRLRVGEEERETITDAEGGYAFEDVPLGPAKLEASAGGFEVQTWDVEVTAGMQPATPRALTPKAETGILRGLTRSFGSEPIRASIAVRNAAGEEVATVRSDEEGRFEIELFPGDYRVTISAPGYRTQKRNVKISNNEVAILNADMREQ